MPDKNFRFAFVSNSHAIAKAVQDYAATQGFALEIRLATMEKALPVAQALLKEGVDVVLGGGGTGKLLRQKLERPVVTIARSHLDVLRALQSAKAETRHIALTCYDMAPESLGTLAELLDIRLRPVPFSSTRELVEGIAQAVREGVGCVVGGGICGEIAHAQGCRHVVVIPGQEVIQRALEDACNIALSQRRDREQSAWLQGIVEVLHDGIIGIDSSGTLTTSNAMAVRLLGLEASPSGLALSASPSLPSTGGMEDIVRALGLRRALTTGRAEADSLQRVAGQDFVITSSPIWVRGQVQGAVASFRPASYIRSMDGKIKAQLRASGFTARYTLQSIVGTCEAMHTLKEKARRFAQTGAALLIQGETGTGKELLAHAVHAASPRQDKAFVALNCAALPETLLESELFGYEEGAFTGARRGGKDGLFVLANGGTIFLDEIADIPAALQVRLLRVLEAKEIMRVGGERSIAVNVRIISSSWKDLAQEVREGRFREDLYYRLATLCLYIPPLRERTGDLTALVEVLLRRHHAEAGCVSAAGLELLARQVWSGNIRELDALLQRYVLLLNGSAPDDYLLQQLLQELPRMGRTPRGTKPQTADLPAPARDFHGRLAGQVLPVEKLKARLDNYEKVVIHEVLAQNQFNRVRTAEILGISVNTLWRKMRG